MVISEDSLSVLVSVTSSPKGVLMSVPNGQTSGLVRGILSRKQWPLQTDQNQNGDFLQP